MRTSYVRGSTGFECFWCVAIVLDPSAIVKIEMVAGGNRNGLPRPRRRSPFLLQFQNPSCRIVATRD
jgi:hypothetical protein